MFQLYNTVQYHCDVWHLTHSACVPVLLTPLPPCATPFSGKRLSRDSAGGGKVAGWVGGCGEAGGQVIGRERHDNHYEREQVALQVGWCLSGLLGLAVDLYFSLEITVLSICSLCFRTTRNTALQTTNYMVWHRGSVRKCCANIVLLQLEYPTCCLSYSEPREVPSVGQSSAHIVLAAF